MKKRLYRYLVPHQENDFLPSLLKARSVALLAFIVLAFYLLSLVTPAFLIKTDFFASVLPSLLVDLTNNERTSRNLPPLAINPVLTQAAQRKARDMAAKGYFAHTSPDGSEPWYWFRGAGYTFSHAGENLAMDFVTSGDVERAWMNSPTHRANIINGHYTEIGIAAIQAVYQNRETMFVVQFFGRPAKVTWSTSHSANSSSLPQPPLPSGAAAPHSALIAHTPGPSIISSRARTSPLPRGTPSPSPLEIIASDETFITVRIADSWEDSSVTSPPIARHAPQSSWAQHKILSFPRFMLYPPYLLLAIVISTTLALTFIIAEARHHHPRDAWYGLFLLALMGGLLIMQEFYDYASVVVR